MKPLEVYLCTNHKLNFKTIHATLLGIHVEGRQKGQNMCLRTNTAHITEDHQGPNLEREKSNCAYS